MTNKNAYLLMHLTTFISDLEACSVVAMSFSIVSVTHNKCEIKQLKQFDLLLHLMLNEC
jgi:hypothetical protein